MDWIVVLLGSITDCGVLTVLPLTMLFCTFDMAHLHSIGIGE
jgi:hypothetical protein